MKCLQFSWGWLGSQECEPKAGKHKGSENTDFLKNQNMSKLLLLVLGTDPRLKMQVGNTVLYIPSQNNAQNAGVCAGMWPSYFITPEAWSRHWALLVNAFNTKFSVTGSWTCSSPCPLCSRSRWDGRRSRRGARSSLGAVSLLPYAQLMKPDRKLCQPQGGKLWLEQTMVFVWKWGKAMNKCVQGANTGCASCQGSGNIFFPRYLFRWAIKATSGEWFLCPFI